MHRRATPLHRCAWGIGPGVGSAPAPPSTPSPSKGIKLVPSRSHSVSHTLLGETISILFSNWSLSRRKGVFGVARELSQESRLPCCGVMYPQLMFENKSIVFSQCHNARTSSREIKTEQKQNTKNNVLNLSQYYDHAFESSSLSDTHVVPPLWPDPPIYPSSMTSMPFRASPHFCEVLSRAPLIDKKCRGGKASKLCKARRKRGRKNLMNSDEFREFHLKGGIVPDCTNYANIATGRWLLTQRPFKISPKNTPTATTWWVVFWGLDLYGWDMSTIHATLTPGGDWEINVKHNWQNPPKNCYQWTAIWETNVRNS